MKESRQSRKITIFAIALSLISIGILVFGFLLVSSDKVVMMQSISNLYNKLDKDLEDDAPLINKIAGSDNIGIRANITTKIDNTSTNIKIDYLENRNNKKSSLNIIAKDDINQLIDTSLVLDKDKLYMFIKDITPMYYTMDMNYVSFIRSLSSDNVDELLNILKDSLNSSISKKDIKKEKVKIKYNNKDKKVSKLTYTVSNKEFRQIFSKFIKTLKKDKKLLGSVAEYFDLSKKELNKKLNEYLKEIPENDEKLFAYSTYYYGFNKIVEYDLDLYKSGYSIKYKDDGDIDDITISNDISSVRIKVENTKNGKKFTGTYIADINSGEEIQFDGTYENNKLVLNIKSDQNYKLVISSKHDNTEENYKYNYDITISVNKLVISNIKIDLEFYFDESVESIKEEYKDITELTEEEMNALDTIFNQFNIDDSFFKTNDIDE